MKKIILTLLLASGFLFSFGQWTWQNPLPQGNGLFSVAFSDSNIGYAIGGLGTILKTDDGGITWNYVQRPTTKNLYSIAVIDNSSCVVVGESGVSYKTSDGANTWVALETSTNQDLNSVFFPDANTGYVGGQAGVIMKTINSGESWTILEGLAYSDVFHFILPMKIPVMQQLDMVQL